MSDLIAEVALLRCRLADLTIVRVWHPGLLRGAMRPAGERRPVHVSLSLPRRAGHVTYVSGSRSPSRVLQALDTCADWREVAIAIDAAGVHGDE